MNRLEYFESGKGLEGVKLGLISLSDLVKYDIYREYLDILATIPETEPKRETIARRETMIKRDCDHWDLCRSIWFFQKPRPKKPNGKKLHNFARNGHS